MPTVTVSDRIQRYALLSTTSEQRNLDRDIKRFSDRLNEALDIDPDTGRSAFKDNDLRILATELNRATGGAVGETFAQALTAYARGGFVVIGPGDVVPRMALTDPTVVQRMSKSRLLVTAETLRLDAARRPEGSDPIPAAGEALIRAALQNLSPNKTTRDSAGTEEALRQFETDRIAALGREPSEPSKEASLETWSADIRSRLGLRDDPRPDGGGAGGGGGGTGGGGGGIPIPLPVIRDAYEWVTTCFPQISAVTPDFSRGVGLCFPEKCARSLATLLRAGSAGPLGAAGVAAVTAAGAGSSIAAIVAAGTAAAGGWVAFIVAICVIVFSFLLDAVITPAGACIHFPWWAGFGPVPYGR